MKTARTATALSAMTARLPRNGLVVSSGIRSPKSTATGRVVLPAEETAGGGGRDATGRGKPVWLARAGMTDAATGGGPRFIEGEDAGDADRFGGSAAGGGPSGALGKVDHMGGAGKGAGAAVRLMPRRGAGLDAGALA